MSSDGDKPDDPNQDFSETPPSDDEGGWLTNWPDAARSHNTCTITDHDGTVSSSTEEVWQGPAAAAALPLQRHALAFRLTGCDRHEQSQFLGDLDGGEWVVAIERVRAFLTGDVAAVAPGTDCPGVEVHAQWHAGSVCCTAQVMDLQPGQVMVVHVDVAVYCM